MSGPTAMMLNALGGQCACEVRPTVGRSAATPHSAAGTRTEPPPSMPGNTSSGLDHCLDKHSGPSADASMAHARTSPLAPHTWLLRRVHTNAGHAALAPTPYAALQAHWLN